MFNLEIYRADSLLTPYGTIIDNNVADISPGVVYIFAKKQNYDLTKPTIDLNFELSLKLDYILDYRL